MTKTATLFLFSCLIALTAGLSAQNSWSHDLAVGTIELSYPGKNKSQGADVYAVPQNTDVEVSVLVQNNSGNPSMPYSVTLVSAVRGERNGSQVGTQRGDSLRSNDKKEHKFRFKASRPGQVVVQAQLKLLQDPPGAGRRTCVDCSARKNCDWPNSCEAGVGFTLCSCHPMTDNPANNEGHVQFEVTPAPGSVAAAPPTKVKGVDLAVSDVQRDPSPKPHMTMILVTVTNLGSEDARGSVVVQVMADGSALRGMISGGIRSGETKSVLIESSRERINTLHVIVDPDNAVPDVNRANNRL